LGRIDESTSGMWACSVAFTLLYVSERDVSARTAAVVTATSSLSDSEQQSSSNSYKYEAM
jgi:hypothetical protein